MKKTDKNADEYSIPIQPLSQLCEDAKFIAAVALLESNAIKIETGLTVLYNIKPLIETNPGAAMQILSSHINAVCSGSEFVGLSEGLGQIANVALLEWGFRMQGESLPPDHISSEKLLDRIQMAWLQTRPQPRIEKNIARDIAERLKRETRSSFRPERLTTLGLYGTAAQKEELKIAALRVADKLERDFGAKLPRAFGEAIKLYELWAPAEQIKR